MTSISTLISLVVALLAAVQSHPNLPPEVRVQALQLAAQALAYAHDQPTLPNTPERSSLNVASTITSSTTSSPVSIPVTTASSATIPHMPPETQAAAEPSGTISATLKSAVQTIAIGSSRITIATLTITNNRDEAILSLGNERKYLTISNSTFQNWTPEISAIVKWQDTSASTAKIAAHSSGDVSFLIVEVPAEAGSFDAAFNEFKFAGQTSGDIVTLEGFPILLGTITVQ